jgi:hypothetical protein
MARRPMMRLFGFVPLMIVYEAIVRNLLEQRFPVFFVPFAQAVPVTEDIRVRPRYEIRDRTATSFIPLEQ